MLIKKLMFVTAFLGLAALSVSKVSAQQGGGISQTDANRDLQIKRVYNQDAIAHATGTVMVYVGAPTASYPGLSVSTTVTPYDSSFAGVVYQTPIPASDWGFIQIQGYNPAVLITSATLKGDLLWPSATAGKFAANSAVFVASESCRAVGMSLSVNASSTSIPAIIFGR